VRHEGVVDPKRVLQPKVVVLWVVHALLRVDAAKEDVIKPLHGDGGDLPVLCLLVLVADGAVTNDGVVVFGEVGSVLGPRPSHHVFHVVAVATLKSRQCKDHVITGRIKTKDGKKPYYFFLPGYHDISRNYASTLKFSQDKANSYSLCRKWEV
jgi:hypothetical protein